MNTTLKIILLEKKNAALKQENSRLKAKIDYVAAMDYPELLEEVENDDRGTGKE